MIFAHERIITNEDIDEVYRINPKEDNLEYSFFTDGEFLYYVTEDQVVYALRELLPGENFRNATEIAKVFGKSYKGLIFYMRKKVKEKKVKEIPDTQLRKQKEVSEYWMDIAGDCRVFMEFDKLYNIVKFIRFIESKNN